MTRIHISSGSDFERQYGYSRAVVQGDWCFVSGTTGLAADGSGFPDSVAAQAENALAIIEKALKEGGFTLADVVRATYYIPFAHYWDEVGAALGAAFGEVCPAITCVVAGLIKPEMMIEIEVTAYKG